MRSLRVAAAVLVVMAVAAWFSGAFELLVFRGDTAAGWSSIGQGVLMMVAALVIDGFATIARAALDHLAASEAALRVIVGRRK